MHGRRNVAMVLLGCAAIAAAGTIAYLFASHHAGFVNTPAVVRGQDGGENTEHATLTHRDGSFVLDIASGRPLADAAQALMHEYGYAITYEDPRYENAIDLVDVSAEVR